MWHRRGNQQNGTPLGTVIALGDELNFVAKNQGYPEDLPVFRFREYNLDKNGVPTFSYLINGVELSDRITSSLTERSLTRRIAVKSSTDISLKVASGARIEQLPDGSFAMHDKNYYLTFDKESVKPVLKTTGAEQELVIHVKGATAPVIQYTLLW